MEQKEAEEFVIQRLNTGMVKEKIAEELSIQMRAPSDLVTRFVDHVSNLYYQKLSQESEISHPVEDESTVKTSGEGYFSDDEIDQNIISEELQSDEEQRFDETASQIPSTPMEFKIGIPEKQPENQILSESEYLSIEKEIDAIEIEQFVLQDLRNQKRYSDIIQKVCERTGWDWDEAQRFVAKTQTKNHPFLSASNRLFMIPFSAVFIIGGLLLLIWSILTFMDFQNGSTGQGSNALITSSIPLIIGGFIASIGIIAGGIFGLYRTLNSQ